MFIAVMREKHQWDDYIEKKNQSKNPLQYHELKYDAALGGHSL